MKRSLGKVHMPKESSLEVTLPGLGRIKNPIILASGCCGFGHEMAKYYDLNVLGSMALKGTTLEPRLGNPQPRMVEAAAGVLNSNGWQNPGVAAVKNEELPKLKQVYDGKIMINVAGLSLAEYIKVVEAMAGCQQVGAFELNVSCPNVEAGGIQFGVDPKMIAQVTREVKKVADKAVYVKLAPNVTDVVELAKAVEAAGADGVSLINTMVSIRFDFKTGRPLLGNKIGGLSGPAIFPQALRMVYQVSQAVKIPVIGMGGVSSGRDVIEMMSAGATGVGVGTASFLDPLAAVKMIEDLPGLLGQIGVKQIKDIIGRSHKF